MQSHFWYQFLCSFIGFVFHGSFFSHFLIGWFSSTAKKNLWNGQLIRLPCERALKTVPETGIKSDFTFCLQPIVICDDHTSCSKRHTSDEEKPFKCKECDKRFLKESLLKSHAKVHSDEKPFVCQYDSCNFRTKMLCSLKVHIRGVHEKERPYKCQNCNSAYLNISHLKRHLKVCSPREWLLEHKTLWFRSVISDYNIQNIILMD